MRWFYLLLIVLSGMLVGTSARAADLVVSRAYFLEGDLADPMSLESVRRQTFTPYSGALSKGFRSSPTWVRLRIDPTGLQEARLVIRIAPTYVDEVTLFDPDCGLACLDTPGDYRPRASGDRIPAGPEDLRALAPGFSLPAGQAPRDIYLRMRNTSFHHLDVQVLPQSRADVVEMQHAAVTVPLFLGMLVAVLIWAALAWTTDKEWVGAAFLFKQTLALAHSALLLGLGRVFLPQALDIGWVDGLFSVLTLAVTAAVTVFELLLLREYRVPQRLWQATAGLVGLSALAALMLAVGLTRQALALNMLVILLAPIGFFVMTLTARGWETPEAAADRALIPRPLMLGYHAVLMVLVGSAAVRAFGFEWFSASWVIQGLLSYAVVTNVLVILLLASRLRRRNTLRQQTEAELRLAQAAMDEQKRRQQDQLMFMANTHHELRTPLNGILGLAELAQGHDVTEDQRLQYLRQITDSGQMLSQILNDVLDVAKIDAGRLELAAVDFDLPALLLQLQPSFAALASAKGLSFRVELAADLPREVRGDPLRLRQIVTNYLGNALKFTRIGGITLRARVAGPLRVRLEVVDTGPGVPEHVMPRLFQRFMQADSSSTRQHGGTGLGLSICRDLAQAMGGSVGCDSVPGEGSAFWAEVQLADPASPSATAGANTDQPAEPAARLDGCRVLVVDDNPVNRHVVHAMLRRAGAHVEEADSGKAALDLMRVAIASGRRFDIALMDIHMPDMDGLECSARLRRLPGCGSFPVVAVTAAALQQDRERALSAGMVDFLVKPVNRRELLGCVARLTRAGGGISGGAAYGPQADPLRPDPAPPAEPAPAPPSRS